MDTTKLKQELRHGANASGVMLILFYLLIYGGSFLLSTILSQFGNIEEGFLGDLFGFLAFTFQYPVTVPLILLAFHLIHGKKYGMRLREVFCKPKVPMKTVFRWILICLGITYASVYVSRFFWMILQALTGWEIVAQDFSSESSWLSMLTNIIAMVIYAPLFEEMMFRGTIFRSTQKGGDLASALLCGIAFGLWHTNYDQTLYTAVMGFAACVLFVKSGSLWAPILMHALMNSIGAFQSIILGSMNLNMTELTDLTSMTDEQAIEFLMENAVPFLFLMLSSFLVMGLMGAGLILLIIELVQHKQLFRFEKAEGDLPTGKKLVICLTSPVMLIACLGLAAFTVIRAMGIV
ncbi:MAG: CPBP family intramembrane metalloprotease [Oscillospiraceae bacterium]|nr:CPBP family intramembrane metalloprotease [Oscillospiraceae bacterium]